MNVDELILESKRVIKEINSIDEEEFNLEQDNIVKIKNLLYKLDFKQYIKNLDLDKLSFNELHEFSSYLSETSIKINKLKEEIELEKFFNQGNIFDFDKLEIELKAKKLLKKYPTFNFEKYKELVKNPPLEIENYQGEVIVYDRFLIKKVIIAINQMIFNEMDIYGTTCGEEGGGKSCLSSQILLWIYTFLYAVGLIKYDYKITEMFFSSIASLLDVQDSKGENDYFQIYVLDEGDELNRQNFREETTKIYKSAMRSERKSQRINWTNLPQIGELDLSITLSRTNFIFYTNMSNNVRVGTLKKGQVDMYIIPRANYIYSPYQKRNITKEEIKNSFSKNFEKKGNYYVSLPKNCIVHKFEFKNIWGFDKDAYDKYIKKENKKKRMTGNIRTSDYIGYILFKKMPQFKNWGSFDLKNKPDKRMYYTIQKWRKGIDNKFMLNPELLAKFDIFTQKE